MLKGQNNQPSMRRLITGFLPILQLIVAHPRHYHDMCGLHIQETGYFDQSYQNH